MFRNKLSCSRGVLQTDLVELVALTVRSLLLGGGSGLCGFLGLLLSLAEVLGVGSELAQLSEHLDVSVLLGDLLGGHSDLLGGLGDHVLGDVLLGRLSGLQLVGSGVVDLSLLGLVSALGEQDQLALVTLESLGVELEGFFGEGVSSGVDSDAYGLGEGRGQLGLLELRQSEASSVS